MKNPTEEKRFLMAVLLTLPLPGLGHVYLGQWLRGVLWFFGVIAVGTALFYVLPGFTKYSGLGYIMAVLAALDVRKLTRKNP